MPAKSLQFTLTCLHFAKQQLEQTDTVALKLSSGLVYGEDIRHQISLPTMDVYIQDILQAPARFMTQLLQPAKSIQHPVDYPENEILFLGYVTTTTLANGTVVEDTKHLVPGHVLDRNSDSGLAGTYIRCQEKVRACVYIVNTSMMSGQTLLRMYTTPVNLSGVMLCPKTTYSGDGLQQQV